jgi:hypothetical protein
MPPNLYKMARYKTRNVQTELQDSRWIRNIGNINSTTLIEEYILLFLALSIVQLFDQEDEIYWKWMADGKYTVASTYECQFQGSYEQFPATAIWQTMSEPKCKFFVWLAVHDRILIASNMQKWNWPCNHFLCALLMYP